MTLLQDLVVGALDLWSKGGGCYGFFEFAWAKKRSD